MSFGTIESAGFRDRMGREDIRGQSERIPHGDYEVSVECYWFRVVICFALARQLTLNTNTL